MSERIIAEFQPQGGEHCITNSLKQIFAYYGKPLSEAMLFGIGEGLDFTYVNLAAFPMVSGRVQIGAFEKTLSRQLQVGLKVKQQKDYAKVFEKTRQMITNGAPVLCYADIPYLSYFAMEEESHFGGHSIVLYGYDDKREVFYVSDRDNSDYPIRTPGGPIAADYHLVPYCEVERARSSNFRPFPANNKYIEFDFSNYLAPNKEMLVTAIQNVCKRMLNPPARLKGLDGIQKFSREVRKWSKFTPEKLSRSGCGNYFMIHADGGTGGGIFRKMYGNFLGESAVLIKSDELQGLGDQFVKISVEWDRIAEMMWKLYETSEPAVLLELSEMAEELHNKETELFSRLSNVMGTVS